MRQPGQILGPDERTLTLRRASFPSFLGDWSSQAGQGTAVRGIGYFAVLKMQVAAVRQHAVQTSSGPGTWPEGFLGFIQSNTPLSQHNNRAMLADGRWDEVGPDRPGCSTVPFSCPLGEKGSGEQCATFQCPLRNNVSGPHSCSPENGDTRVQAPAARAESQWRSPFEKLQEPNLKCSWRELEHVRAARGCPQVEAGRVWRVASAQQARGSGTGRTPQRQTGGGTP